MAAWAALELTPAVPRASASEVISAPPVAPVSAAAAAAEPGSFPVEPVVVKARRLEGVDTVALVGTIHSSLMASLDNVGETELPKGQRRSLAWRLADIFEYRVDMSRDLDDGDRFHVLVERAQKPNGKVVVNKIIGAKLALGTKEYEAVHFKSRNSSSEWFDGKGKSLTASFLRAPLNFRRISSVFGGRSHPIFGTWRNHTGTDYAAAMGTPVRAIGDGVVIRAGRMGGYGNVIDIRHNNGYVSRYGHLSRFASSLRPGRRVTMGSTIGYVGMTGWATGPHLHFEIRIGGAPRDPKLALRGKSGDALTASEAGLFNEIRAHTMSILNANVNDRADSRVASAKKISAN
jgi:murein DD-endopeptidase MepM/ murein hydrolase activator NlpD